MDKIDEARELLKMLGMPKALNENKFLEPRENEDYGGSHGNKSR